LRPEVVREAKVCERLGHLRQAKLRVGGEANLQAEERSGDPVEDGLRFGSDPCGNEAGLLQGRFHRGSSFRFRASGRSTADWISRCRTAWRTHRSIAASR